MLELVGDRTGRDIGDEIRPDALVEPPLVATRSSAGPRPCVWLACYRDLPCRYETLVATPHRTSSHNSIPASRREVRSLDHTSRGQAELSAVRTAVPRISGRTIGSAFGILVWSIASTLNERGAQVGLGVAVAVAAVGEEAPRLLEAVLPAGAVEASSARTCSMKSSRPPGLRTRASSSIAATGSGIVQRTSVATAVSKVSSANGQRFGGRRDEAHRSARRRGDRRAARPRLAPPGVCAAARPCAGRARPGSGPRRRPRRGRGSRRSRRRSRSRGRAPPPAARRASRRGRSPRSPSAPGRRNGRTTRPQVASYALPIAPAAICSVDHTGRGQVGKRQRAAWSSAAGSPRRQVAVVLRRVGRRRSA